MLISALLVIVICVALQTVMMYRSTQPAQRIFAVPTPQGECWVNSQGGMHCWRR